MFKKENSVCILLEVLIVWFVSFLYGFVFLIILLYVLDGVIVILIVFVVVFSVVCVRVWLMFMWILWLFVEYLDSS